MPLAAGLAAGYRRLPPAFPDPEDVPLHPREENLTPEIDIATRRVYAQQFDTQTVADIDALFPAHEASFHRRIDYTHEDTLRPYARDHGRKCLAHPRRQRQGGNTFLDIPLDLA